MTTPQFITEYARIASAHAAEGKVPPQAWEVAEQYLFDGRIDQFRATAFMMDFYTGELRHQITQSWARGESFGGQ